MSTTARRFRCLIVDDDASILKLLRSFLQFDLGDAVTLECVSDSRTAREMLADGRWDIVLVDIEVPGTKELELLRLAQQANPWCRVIVITGHSTWDRISAAIEQGATDYLLKPIDREELKEVVHVECQRLLRWSKLLGASMRAPARV